MRQPIVYGLLSVLIGTTALGSGQCPDWIKNKSNFPLCPQRQGSASTLVPEINPMGAVVVSDQAQRPDFEFTSNVVQKILIAGGQNPPMIILPVTIGTMEKIQRRIDETPVSSEQKRKWKAALVKVDAPSYTWQQDYMQPFIDPRTGKIQIRGVTGYRTSHVKDSVSEIAKALGDCGMEAAPLDTKNYSTNGQNGGNIETLPGGICLFGDDSFDSNERYKEYGEQFCGTGPDDQVTVPTSWLAIGHSDEVVKVVRNNTKEAPCNFSVVVASPKKAIELMRQNPNKNFLESTAEKRQMNSNIDNERMNSSRGLSWLCTGYGDYKRSQQAPSQGAPKKGTTQIFDPLKLFISVAYANAIPLKKLRLPGEPEEDVCSTLTNDQVLRVFKHDEKVLNFNYAIQEKMDSLKNDIKSKLKKKLPQCEVDYIDAPDLFYGGSGMVERGRYVTNSMGEGNSFLPNPTNALSVNDTLISPEPQNAAFKNYLEAEYKKRGIRADFVDTFEYAHIGNGNLHCVTNGMYLCKPGGQ